MAGSSNKKGGITGWLIIIFIFIIIFGTIFIGRFFKKEEKIKLAFKNGDPISFLVVGYNKDKIIKGSFVLIYHPKTNKCAAVSILPKTYISFGRKKYFTLEEALTKKVNNEDILSSVSKLIGYDINYYFFIKKKNFIRLIDMIGGVEIFTEGHSNPELDVNIPSGVILLDGDKSVEYLSFLNKEENNYEYNQLARLQNYIKGFLKLKNDFLEQFNEKIIVNYIYKTVSTNMSINEFSILFREIRNKFEDGSKDYSKGLNSIIVYCDKKNIEGYEFIYLPKKSGKWIKTEVKDAVNNLQLAYNEGEMGHIVVEILNGTNATGLAGRTGEYLTSYGFDIFNITNADSDDYENTVIIAYENEQKAKKLADLIKCDMIVTKEEKLDEKIDVTLILGMDFDGKIVR